MRSPNPDGAPRQGRFHHRYGLCALYLFVLVSESCGQAQTKPTTPIANSPQTQPPTGYTLDSKSLDPKSNAFAIQFSYSRNAQTGVYTLNSAGTQPAKIIIDYTGGAPYRAVKLKFTFTVKGKPDQKGVTTSFTKSATTSPDTPKVGSAADAPRTYSIDVSDVATAVIGQLNNDLPPNLDPTQQTFDWGGAALTVIPVDYNPVTGIGTDDIEKSVGPGPLPVIFKKAMGEKPPAPAGN